MHRKTMQICLTGSTNPEIPDVQPSVQDGNDPKLQGRKSIGLLNICIVRTSLQLHRMGHKTDTCIIKFLLIKIVANSFLLRKI